jgi:hypothetical protein
VTNFPRPIVPAEPRVAEQPPVEARTARELIEAGWQAALDVHASYGAAGWSSLKQEVIDQIVAGPLEEERIPRHQYPLSQALRDAALEEVGQDARRVRVEIRRTVLAYCSRLLKVHRLQHMDQRLRREIEFETRWLMRKIGLEFEFEVEMDESTVRLTAPET